jgi:hypothetical protein
MAGFEPGLPVATTEESEGVTYAVFQYRKDLTRTSIRHTVMGSSDLVHWQALPDTLARAQGTVEVRQVRELLGAQPRFLRLDISRQ